MSGRLRGFALPTPGMSPIALSINPASAIADDKVERAANELGRASADEVGANARSSGVFVQRLVAGSARQIIMDHLQHGGDARNYGWRRSPRGDGVHNRRVGAASIAHPIADLRPGFDHAQGNAGASWELASVPCAVREKLPAGSGSPPPPAIACGPAEKTIASAVKNRARRVFIDRLLPAQRCSAPRLTFFYWSDFRQATALFPPKLRR